MTFERSIEADEPWEDFFPDTGHGDFPECHGEPPTCDCLDEDEDEETNTEVFRDGSLHLCAKKCSTCIYRPGNLMTLNEGRRESMESEAVANQSVIPCHKTIFGETVGPAICRGYWDVHKHDVGLLSAAERMGLIREVDAG